MNTGARQACRLGLVFVSGTILLSSPGLFWRPAPDNSRPYATSLNEISCITSVLQIDQELAKIMSDLQEGHLGGGGRAYTLTQRDAYATLCARRDELMQQSQSGNEGNYYTKR